MKNKTNSERLNRTAAFVSANLEELLSLLPPSQLAKDIRKMIDRIDVGGRFKTGQLGSNQNQPLFTV
jgi:hypothetical protein